MRVRERGGRVEALALKTKLALEKKAATPPEH